jgi:hypothetical protein
LDDSKVNPGTTFKGLEIELHRFGGARVLRVVHPGAQQIPEHRHDWAYIGLYTAGRYSERYDGGEAEMRGPSAVLHPSGRPHADTVEAEGLETLTIEFDPPWLRLHGFNDKLDRSRAWSGGQTASGRGDWQQPCWTRAPMNCRSAAPRWNSCSWRWRASQAPLPPG